MLVSAFLSFGLITVGYTLGKINLTGTLCLFAIYGLTYLRWYYLEIKRLDTKQ
jgi:hypothetical protein